MKIRAELVAQSWNKSDMKSWRRSNDGDAFCLARDLCLDPFPFGHLVTVTGVRQRQGQENPHSPYHFHHYHNNFRGFPGQFQSLLTD